MDNKCTRHTQWIEFKRKDYRIRTYEINKISLSCFDDKIYIRNIGYNGLALGYYN